MSGWRGRAWFGTKILITMVLLVGGAPVPGWPIEAAPALMQDGGGYFSLDRRSLEEAIRQDLGLPSGSKFTIDHLPHHFRGPVGASISTALSREGTPEDGKIRYRLNIMEGGVAREAFYFLVRIPVSRQSSLLGTAEPSHQGGASGMEDQGSAVHAGETVHVTVEGKGFRIRFPGISQAGGGIGDRIPIINPLSGRSMTGEVTGRDRVLVHLGGGAS